MKFVVYLSFFFFSCTHHIFSQIAFQRIFGTGTFCKYASPNSSGNFIATLDSAGIKNYKFDRFGNVIWNNSIPPFNLETPGSIEQERNGIYIFCGTSKDTITGLNRGLVLVLSNTGDTLSSKFITPLPGINNYGNVILPGLSGDYIFNMFEDGPSSADTSRLIKLDLNLNILWSVFAGNSPLRSSAVIQDKDSDIVFTYYNPLNHGSISVEKYSDNGNFIASKTIYDSSSCSCISSHCIAEAKDGGYIIGAEFEQQSLLIKLDNNLDTVWSKHLNWPLNNYPVSVAQDRDYGFFVLINNSGEISLYHVNGYGDSLSVHAFNPMVYTEALNMKHSYDGGYIISGTTYDYNNISHGYLLKTDSLGRFTPQVTITVNGPLALCGADSVMLSGPSGNYLYDWSTGDTTQTITVNSPGSYYLTVTGNTGNSATSFAINITGGVPVIPTITNYVDYLQSSVALNYQWYHNGTFIPGATNDTLHTTLTGTFNVVVTDTNGCLSVSPLFFYSWTGIPENSITSKSVYPVPSDNYISIYLNEKCSAIIRDNQNRIIKKEFYLPAGENVIDISGFSNGIYFIEFNDNINSDFRRFVVVR